MQIDVPSSLASDNMRDRKYIVCFYQFSAGPGGAKTFRK